MQSCKLAAIPLSGMYMAVLEAKWDPLGQENSGVEGIYQYMKMKGADGVRK